MLPYANYEAISLSGSSIYPFDQNGYRTATTVHEILCLANGSVTVYPMAGSPFTWAGKTSESIRVLCSAVTVSGGEFIGFRAKFEKNPFYGRGDQY